jgi:hypothetical protein
MMWNVENGVGGAVVYADRTLESFGVFVGSIGDVS